MRYDWLGCVGLGAALCSSLISFFFKFVLLQFGLDCGMNLARGLVDSLILVIMAVWLEKCKCMNSLSFLHTVAQS